MFPSSYHGKCTSRSPPLNRHWDIRPGKHKRASRNLDNPFGGCASRPCRQILSLVGNIRSDYRKVAIFHLNNVRTTLAARAFTSFRWWWAKSSHKHTPHVTIVASPVKPLFVYAEEVAPQKQRDAVCSNVARLLKEERERQNLSLNVLAARAGLSRQMVSYIEQEERNPTLETLLRLSGALGIELDELIKTAKIRAAKS